MSPPPATREALGSRLEDIAVELNWLSARPAHLPSADAAFLEAMANALEDFGADVRHYRGARAGAVARLLEDLAPDLAMALTTARAQRDRLLSAAAGVLGRRTDGSIADLEVAVNEVAAQVAKEGG